MLKVSLKLGEKKRKRIGLVWSSASAFRYDSKRSLKLEEFVKSLPKGLDTEVGAEGDKLSKSIVQKILLARSIANKPGLLLLENSIVFIEKTDREIIIDFLCSKAQQWTLITTSSDVYFRSSCMRMVEMKITKTRNI